MINYLFFLMILFLQAAEDNEMSLEVGEIIEQIEELDDGWWSGVGAGGTKSGMFPGRFDLLSIWPS
jgi:hypothetical protein